MAIMVEEIIKHIIEKPKDHYRFSIEKTLGDTKNRIVIKVAGDDLRQVLLDLKVAIQGAV